MATRNRRHKPPCRVRYEQAHPTVALRLTLGLKERLKQHLEARDINAATFVKEALGAHPIDTVEWRRSGGRIARRAIGKGMRTVASGRSQDWAARRTS